MSDYNTYMGKNNCPLLRDVIMARWGTWINAAAFFAKILQDLTRIFQNYLMIWHPLRKTDLEALPLPWRS